MLKGIDNKIDGQNSMSVSTRLSFMWSVSIFYILNGCYVPDTIAGTWDSSLNKANQDPCLLGGDELVEVRMEGRGGQSICGK